MAIKPKCFIAMRFGDSDVDLLFKNVLKPAIQKAGFSARVVNRINHNDDIDDRIVKEIRGCDICVADLTYARPSVYYEAGFVSGLGKPVIYTVRQDHLARKSQEPHVVHFDLQMRNIIPWSRVDDEEAAKDLLSRLRLVGGPIVKSKQIQLQMREEQSEFATHSVATRLRLVKSDCIDFLVRDGYSRFRGVPREVYKRRVGNYEHFVLLITEDRNLSSIEDLSRWIVEEPARKHSISSIYLMTKSIRATTFHSRFDWMTPDAESKLVRSVNLIQKAPASKKRNAIVWANPSKPVKSHIIEVGLIDNIKSATEAKASFQQMITQSQGVMRDLLRESPHRPIG